MDEVVQGVVPLEFCTVTTRHTTVVTRRSTGVVTRHSPLWQCSAPAIALALASPMAMLFNHLDVEVRYNKLIIT